MGQPMQDTTKTQNPPAGDRTTASGQDKPAESSPTGAGVNTGAGTTRPKTAAELEADRMYEERMEEEYAKRDGGS